MLGILALLMQMLPALANSEDGIWIEICSDFGPVMMQIDAAETPAGGRSFCPDCDDCTLCATAVPLILADALAVRIDVPASRSTEFSVLPGTRNLPKHLRPVTRAPPCDDIQCSAHLPRLSPSTLLLNGGAPWI